MTQLKKEPNRYLRLLLSCIVLFCVGVIYAWSVLKVKPSAEFGWTGTQQQFCFTLTLCFFCLGGLASGLLAKKLSIRIRMLIAAVLIIAGFDIAACLSGSIALMYLAYGVMAASGIGIVYNVIISATNAYFPDKKGLASGAQMMSFGFSTLLLGKLAKYLYDSPFGWRNTYALFGVVIGVVVAIAAFLTRMPEKAPAKPGAATTADIETRDMIKRVSFWKLFAFFTLLAAVGSTAISFGNQFFLDIGFSSNAAVTAVGLVSVCNGLGRLCSGWLFDKGGLRKAQYATSFVVLLAAGITLISLIAGGAQPAAASPDSPIATLSEGAQADTASPGDIAAALSESAPSAVADTPDAQSKGGFVMWLGAVGLCLCGFSYGFSPTMSAAFTSAFYGSKYFPLNFSVLNLVLIPASFMSTLAGAIGSYTVTFIVLAGVSAIGLVINFSIRKA